MKINQYKWDEMKLADKVQIVKENHRNYKTGISAYIVTNERGVPLDTVGILLEYMDHAERVLELVKKTSEEFEVMRRMALMA
jgi:hypothetical protein